MTGGREVNGSGEVRARIARELRGVGLRPGGAVLVHSSLRSLGPVAGGAETVIEGLLEALGPEGTLLLPALSYETVGEANPFFDVAATPSCVGAIPEHFRTRPGTLRSVCPTHSVCGVGPSAGWLLGGHHEDGTPCGPNSPFRRLRECGGQVLMLGCGLRPNTSMHAVEETVEPPYLFAGSVEYRVRHADGSEAVVLLRRHGFRGYAQRYDRLADVLPPGALRVGRVLEAAVHVIECDAMWLAGEAALRRDPLHFVEAVSS
jgi:aminoglycoside 3-N-acetyltransferase